MSRDACVENFWNLIELKMFIVFPKYLRNILKLRGYDSAASIKYITKEDIENFEVFAKTAMTNLLPENSNIMDYFHIFAGPDDFEIVPGHKILLEEVVLYIKEMTDQHGKGYFNFNDSVGSSSKASSKSLVNKPCNKRVSSSKSKRSPAHKISYGDSQKNLSPSTHLKINPPLSVSNRTFSTNYLANYNCASATNMKNSKYETDSDSSDSNIASNTNIGKRRRLYSNQYTDNRSNSIRGLDKTSTEKKLNTTTKRLETAQEFCESNEKEENTGTRSNKIVNPFNTEFRCPECGKEIKNNGLNDTNASDRQIQLNTYSEILNETDDSTDELIILKALLDSAIKNRSRKKSGYRHSDIIKIFAGFIKMVAGLLAYETLHANLPLSLPSPSTVDRFIKDSGPSIVEGVPRINELVEYLNSRNLPLKVSFSEDATRITAKISYDPITNQLVGFALPLDNNGMPIPFSFKARNSKEIESHFKNPTNKISSLVYVQMIQPLAQNVPPFCLNIFLSDNVFNAEGVRRRWNFLKNELQKENVVVDNFATDGDGRYLKAMKINSDLGVQDKSFLNCCWFACGSSLNETYVQDPTHVGGKLRCRALKVSRITPIGQKLISISHLQYLIDHVSKDKHLLTSYDIEPKDKQNFQSVQKMCSLKTISCMQEFVPGSEGTAMYLKAMNYAIYPYLDPEMNVEERIYKIWYSLFFFRIWRSFIIMNTVPKSSTKLMVKYTLKECFISSNCYTCLELNAHTLVKQIMKCNVENITSATNNEDHESDKLFVPSLLDSQPCESLFRQMRSFTSTFSTIVNCTMYDAIHRIRKVQLQSDIINSCSGTIKFPRFDKKKESTRTRQNHYLSKIAIIAEIEKAKTDISEDLVKLGIFKKSEIKLLNFECQIKPEPKPRSQSSIDLSEDLYEFESDDSLSNSDNECEPEQEQEQNLEQNRNVTIDDDENQSDSEDKHTLSSLTGQLSMRDYSQTELHVKENSPFAIVVDGAGKESVVRKSSICWLLSKDKCKLSGDRLQRVKEKEFDMNVSMQNQLFSTESLLLQNDDVYVGDWCLFEINKKLRIGLVLSFSYLAGTSLKSKEYTRSFAPVAAPAEASNKGIGVLCSWFNWDGQGHLISTTDFNHHFSKIESYRGTMKTPTYTGENLYVSIDLVTILDNMNESLVNFKENRMQEESCNFTNKPLMEEHISVLDYVICEFETMCKTVRHFIGQVISIEVTADDDREEKEFKVKFLRKSQVKSSKISRKLFAYPNVDDISYVSLHNIIHVLKNPSMSRRNSIFFNDPEIEKYGF